MMAAKGASVFLLCHWFLPCGNARKPTLRRNANSDSEPMTDQFFYSKL